MARKQDSNAEAWATYGRLLKYVRPYRGVMAIAMVGLALDAGASTLFTLLMKPMLDGTFIERDAELIATLPFAIIGLFLVRGIASYFAQYGLAWAGRNTVRDLRHELFSRYLTLPTHYFDTHSSGQTISRLTFDVEQIAQASSNAVTILLRDTLTIIGLVSVMIYHSFQLTLAILVMAPVIAAVITYVSRRFRRIGRNIQDSMGDVTQITEEVVNGHRVVKVFGGREQEVERFSKINNANRSQHIKLSSTSAASAAFVQFVAALALAGIVYMATSDAMLDSFTPGTFMSFMSAMLLILPSLKNLTNVHSVIQRGVAAGDSIFRVLDQDAESDTGTVSMQRARGKVEVRDVRFAYDSEKGDVLNGINFTAEPGSVTAVVGRSGSGKSSLVSLIPRFYDVNEGAILIDGHPIAELNRTDLRRQIALVSQDVILFNDTIARNIAYGSIGERSEEQVRAAAKAAHCLEFVDQLPDGLQSMVGEKGVLLSGGQRQRIAIARAILKDAPILILDEATSALDSESERVIQEALAEVMKNRTTIVIAHRLSTIESADQVLVLSGGKVVEQGTHQQLLDANGHYAALHRLQFQDGV